MDRFFKQLVFGAIYLSIFGGIGYGIQRLTIPQATCTDNIRNHGEDGVDCGVVCGNLCVPAIQPLKVQSTTLLKEPDGSFDIVARILNPNLVYGSGHIAYTVSFQDSGGSDIDGQSQDGVFYIMSNQQRYLILSALQVGGNPASAKITIKDVTWTLIKTGEAPKVDFSLRREVFTPSAGGASFEGVLQNTSDFDFSKVEIGVILLDGSGQPVAVNSTQALTFLSKEERYFKVQWPGAVPDSATRIVDAVTNVFANGNFIKRYGSGEKFQQYQ